MNKKWYICTLVIILAFLGGIASKEQVQTPNQEIVLQFSKATVTQDEAQIAITAVRHQLHAIGVHDISVTDLKEGYLKITYFSSTAAASIKKMLSEEGSFKVDHETPVDVPSDDKQLAYNLDVYEIQSGKDAKFLFSGKIGIQHNTDHDRLSNPNAFAHYKTANYSVYEQKNEIAYKFHSHDGIAIDHISYNIPEVRAGPCLTI